MTEQQFKDLKIGQEVTREGNVYKVVKTYPIQRIIMVICVFEIKVPFRYEDVELVVKDKLVEFLCDNNHDGLTVNDNTFLADKIRQIVRKEVIDSLKFPSYDDYSLAGIITYQQRYEWFITQVKSLNR